MKNSRFRLGRHFNLSYFTLMLNCGFYRKITQNTVGRKWKKIMFVCKTLPSLFNFSTFFRFYTSMQSNQLTLIGVIRFLMLLYMEINVGKKTKTT